MASGGGSWLVIEELLERGDPAFVNALRQVEDAPRLATFAASWHQDRRPAARRFLLEYLKQPLNAFGHEGLVKRLFKLAEKAGDDEVMAHFLYLFDRSIRREVRSTFRWQHLAFNSLREAELQAKAWEAEGADLVTTNNWGSNHQVTARWTEERLMLPRRSTMPRGEGTKHRNPRTGRDVWVLDLATRLGWQARGVKRARDLPDHLRKKLEDCRLFSVHTRHYLRRRAWRYFRILGKTSPDRYVPAVVLALKLYENSDVEDGLALLDNWGLVHALFHHSAALWPRSHGWALHPGRTLKELKPAPAYPELWQKQLQAFLDLLAGARCRPVRQWVLYYLKLEPAILGRASADQLFDLLKLDMPEIVGMAAEALKHHPNLGQISASRWLELFGAAAPACLDIVSALVDANVRGEVLPLEQLIDLTSSRPTPLARLGFAWLQKRALATDDIKTLWRLLDAQAEPLRPQIVRWLRGVLGQAVAFEPAWVLEFLDSRHSDVRGEGWAWLLAEPRARDDVHIWQRLLESPYDDVRLPLLEHLEGRVAGRAPTLTNNVNLDPDLLRLLWATVLLNVQRGNRKKPMVIRQIVSRLADRPDDAAKLLPILRVALRSVRGPEWRAGLAGVVTFVENHPKSAGVVQEMFPELEVATISM